MQMTDKQRQEFAASLNQIGKTLSEFNKFMREWEKANRPQIVTARNRLVDAFVEAGVQMTEAMEKHRKTDHCS